MYDKYAVWITNVVKIYDVSLAWIFIIIFMLWNPYQGKTSQVSSLLSQSQMHSSVLHSRPFIELQIRKPLHLMGQSNVSYSSKRSPPKQNLDYFINPKQSVVERNYKESTLRQNPFISAKPYRYKPVNLYEQKPAELSLWQKQKYLSSYTPRVQIHTQEGFSTSVINDQSPFRISKAERIAQILGQSPRDINWRNQQPQYDNNSMIKKDVVLQRQPLQRQQQSQKSKLLKKQSFGQRETPPIKQQLAQNNKLKVPEKISSNQNDSQMIKTQTSLIHNLANIPQNKPMPQTETVNMTDSKVFQYKLGTNLRIREDQQQQYNFDTGKLLRLTQANRQLDETSRFNSLRPPSTIQLGDTIYELITFS